MTDRYVVKLTRAWGSTILYMGDKGECEFIARDLNTQYQTDEYKVEEYKK